MKIDILTLFPEMFEPILKTSILKRAQDADAVTFAVHNLRDWATDKHKTVDDSPYGGGPGMVLKVDVIDSALRDLKSQVTSHKLQVSNKSKLSSRVILLTPQGRTFTQATAHRLAKKSHLILVAGHYEGFDERVRALVDDEISIGDYILTGGELPAMILVDAVTRLLPGVLGEEDSLREESFAATGAPARWPKDSSEVKEERLLEYPQFTRPESYQPVSIARQRPLTVPAILKSGHHAQIAAWRRAQARARTQKRRPDLLNSS